MILVRFPAKTRATLPGAITKLAQDFGDQLVGAFVVVRPGGDSHWPQIHALDLHPYRIILTT